MACAVCRSPYREVIDAHLASRTQLVTTLASTHDLTRAQLQWHKKRHMPVPSTAPAQPQLAQPPATQGDIASTETSIRARERFLKAYSTTGNVSAAARRAGVKRHMVYVWQESDSDFAMAFREAAIKATEALEREAWRRAKDGVAEPVYQHGRLVGTIQRYSDALLMFLLKARAPDKYRDNVSVSVTPVIKAVAGIDPADVV